jgi:hypothetical protein
MSIIPSLKKLRQKILEFQAILDYMVRPCLKEKEWRGGRKSGSRNH